MTGITSKKILPPLMLLGVLFCLAFFPPASLAQDGSSAEELEEYVGAGGVKWEAADDGQEDLQNAQATMGSLFGNGKTMAIPPQLAGGTLALPSFDSKDLEIEKEAVEPPPGLDGVERDPSDEIRD